MTFATLPAWAGWVVLAAALAAGVGAFLLKLKPPQIVVPSLILWRRVLDERREQSLWERIRWAVSLAAVVLITAAIALAVLRPQLAPARAPRSGDAANPTGAASAARAQQTAAADRRGIAIVLDSSWSMLAETSNGRTRWDRAVARARALASSAGGETVVLATTADGVIEGPTPDAALIEAALDRVAPGGESSAWSGADVFGARDTYFLTDGAVARPLDPDVNVESVFEPAGNVAITAFDVRPGATLDSAGDAFLSVANYAAQAQDVHVTLSRGGSALVDVHVNLAPGTATERAVPLARGGDPRLRASISASTNALLVDDEAVAWIPGAQPVAVTVVSDQPAPFGAFLSQDPAVNATFVSPKAYVPSAENVVIFDGVTPAAPPKAPALYIAPPALKESELLPEWAPGARHPILNGVDVSTLFPDRAGTLAEDGLVSIAESVKHTPLVYVHDGVDRRYAVFTFSVAGSKLMLAPAFPVLLGNAIDWLAHPAPMAVRRPGPVTFDGIVGALVGPDNRPVPLVTVGGASTANLARTGFYTLTTAGATSVVAVNAGDPAISDLQRTRLPQAAARDASAGTSRGRPWWILAAAMAVGLITIEWITWQRRITV